MNIEITHINGTKHIKHGHLVTPLDEVMQACDAGLFDDCQPFYEVVKLFLSHSTNPEERPVIPMLRQMIVANTVDWIRRKYGVAEWRHRGVHVTVDATLIRTAFVTRIEPVIEAADDHPLEEKLTCFYGAMLGSFELDLLSTWGKGIITELMDDLLDDFIRAMPYTPFSATIH